MAMSRICAENRSIFQRGTWVLRNRPLAISKQAAKMGCRGFPGTKPKLSGSGAIHTGAVFYPLADSK
jgi:hypothetical protein